MSWAARSRSRRWIYAARSCLGTTITYSPWSTSSNSSPALWLISDATSAKRLADFEEEGERKRNGDPVAGVEKILSQNPFEPPTRQTKRSPKPLFHFATREERDDLEDGFMAFLGQYQIASEAFRGGNLNAAAWFPEGCYPPALPFRGALPPKQRPWPPTRRIEKLDSGAVERGEMPVVEIVPVVEARARGQPP